MPRKNRSPRDHSDDQDRWDSLRAGWRRTETKRGVDWNVQPVTGRSSEKQYVCPQCGGSIAPGVAHLVVWRADGILGDSADLANRRHWHEHCWRVS